MKKVYLIIISFIFYSNCENIKEGQIKRIKEGIIGLLRRNANMVFVNTKKEEFIFIKKNIENSYIKLLFFLNRGPIINHNIDNQNPSIEIETKILLGHKKEKFSINSEIDFNKNSHFIETEELQKFIETDLDNITNIIYKELNKKNDICNIF